MTIPFAVVLAVMLRLPHYDRTESLEQRVELITPVARVISELGLTVPATARLIALGEKETHYARYVLEGRCLDGPKDAQCDRDTRTGLPRARGPWQVWAWCRPAWAAEDGSEDALRAGARCSAGLLSAASARCAREAATPLEGAFAGYRGRNCRWSGAAERAALARVVEAMLWEELARAGATSMWHGAAVPA